MDFVQRINDIDESIENDYLNLVTSKYRVILEEIKTRAVKHMQNEKGIQEIQLCIDGPTEFSLTKDGKFSHQIRGEIGLIDLPKVYQERDDYIASCAGNQYPTTPSVHYAMKQAVNDLRNCVRKSLADVI